jgi:hypothetical protein
MPSISLIEEGGKPIAFITIPKEKRDKNPFLKDIHNQILYLHDDNSGLKEISIDEGTIFPLMKSKKDEKQNVRIAIIGKSGSGKSVYIGRMLDVMKSAKFGDPEKDIVIISGVDEDTPLDKTRGSGEKKSAPERIDIYGDEIKDMDLKDFENCIVVYDDIENLTDKSVNKMIHNLRNSMLEKGRHHQTDIISVSHNALASNTTRLLHSESTACVIFPSYMNSHQMKSYLTKYLGLSKTNIDKIIELGNISRGVYISNTAPCYAVYDKGIILLK